MKELEFEIIKKNRVWIEATTGGYKCKIKVSPETENLTVGTHTVFVKDISVRSKYGTDLKFEVIGDAKEEGITTLKHFKYNSILRQRCLDLGGKWDKDEGAWIFSDLVADRIDTLEEYYNSELLNIEIRFTDDSYSDCESISFCGYTVATACGRDSGAKIADGISLISGGFDSGGSMKNWKTTVRENTIIRLRIPTKIYDNLVDYSEHYISAHIID